MPRLRLALAAEPGMRTREAVALLPFVGLSAVHIGAKLTRSSRLAHVTKRGLMPLLGVRVVAGPHPHGHSGSLLVANMVLSWLGDITIDRSFRTGLAAFLAGHLCLIALFWAGMRGRISAWSLAVIPWLVFVAVVMRKRSGPLYPAILAYALILGAMATSATRGNRRTSLGGILFVISDTTLALRQFTPWLKSSAWGSVVMASYVAAQALLVDGVLDPATREARY